MLKTNYWEVNPRYPQADIIYQAAQLICQGELVAFPTETVYGLGADALQAAAAEKIFIAKGRPADHPLLVHISRKEHVGMLVKDVSPAARLLMEHFWPGPLSIIMPASEQVPAIVRGGTSGVGLRMPSHPVAIALINATGPLAAPSANLYGRPSPTSAEHVKADLNGRIAGVLDAGATGSGLESTVIDLNGSYSILRRGGIPTEAVEALLGIKFALPEVLNAPPTAYNSPVQVILNETAGEMLQKNKILQQAGKKIALVHISTAQHKYPGNFVKEYVLKTDIAEHSLFSILRDAEEKKIDILLFTPFSEKNSDLNQAVIDRLHRAAGQKTKGG